MSVSNRAKLIGKLHTALKKHYTVPPAQPARPLLEHVLYASLLEDCPSDLADEGLAKCEQEFFDWNEVRVTTVTELAQVLSNLPSPNRAAMRLKGNLQGIFEEFYTFDLDHLKKENLGKATAKFAEMQGMTPFVLSYAVQHGLGGHSIPVDYSSMVLMHVLGIVTASEAKKQKVPGLERAVPKNKGVEFGVLLHQAAAALNADPKDKKGRTLLDAVVKGGGKLYDQWLVTKEQNKEELQKKRDDEKQAAEEAKREAEAAEAEAKRAAEEKKAAAAAKKAAATRKNAQLTAAEQAALTAEKAARAAAKSGKKKPPKKATTADAAPVAGKKATPAKASESKSDETKTGRAKSAAKKPDAKKPDSTKPAEKKSAGEKTAKKKPATKATPVAPHKTGKKKPAAKKKPASKKKPAAKKKPAEKKAPAKKKPPVKKAAAGKTATKKTPAKKSANRKLTKRKPK